MAYKNNLKYYFAIRLYHRALSKSSLPLSRLEKILNEEIEATEAEKREITLTINRVNIKIGEWLVNEDEIFPKNKEEK